MSLFFSRRSFLGTAGMLLCGAGRVEPQIQDLEAALGGRIGIAAYDRTTKRAFEHRADERFAMCSTFKASLTAAILRQADHGVLSLKERISIEHDRILPNSPALSLSQPGATLSIEELCAAAVEVSDNSAANMLLSKLGGPAAMTSFFRSLGDQISRLDRMELDLNSNIPGDLRDTTTPKAMSMNLKTILIDDAELHADSRARLIGWMLAEKNGGRRIRAGAPVGWRVANKPGTSVNGAVNDIAVMWREDGSPIVMSIYTNAPDASVQRNEEAIQSATRLACSYLSMPPHQNGRGA